MTPLWTPTPDLIANCAMTKFRLAVNRQYALDLQDDKQLYDWSTENYPELWNAVWDFCGVVGDKGERLVENKDQMPGCRFFSGCATELCRKSFAWRAKRSADCLSFLGRR